MADIKIAGVSVALSSASKITYEQLMKVALTAEKYYRNPQAEELIDKELREHGFKPTQTSRVEVKKDNDTDGSKDAQTGDTRKPKRNRRKSKD